MRQYLRQELTLFFKNKKNIFIYVCLLFLSLFYWIQVGKEHVIIEQTSYQEIESRLDYRENFLETVNLGGTVHSDVLQAVDFFKIANPIDEKRLDALNRENYQDYALATKEWFEVSPQPRPEYFLKGSQFASLDQFFNQQAMVVKMSDYAQGYLPLSLSIMNEETAWQSLVRAMAWLLPLVLLLVAIVFSVDLFSLDRKKKTLVDSYPITHFQKIIGKALVAFLGTILALLPLSIGFVGIGLTSGFGSPHLPVEITLYPTNAISNLYLVFSTEPIWVYICQSLLLIVLLVWCAILLSILFNLLFTKEYVVLVLMISLLFVDRLYQRNGYGDIHNISQYPTSYIRVGEVVTGYQGYFWSAANVTWLKGILVISIYCLLITGLLWIIPHMKKRR